MRARALLLCGFAACCAASLAAQQDHTDLLQRVREKVKNTVERLPRYMCTETIDRKRLKTDGDFLISSCKDLARLQANPAWKLWQASADRLRVDVAIAGGNEIYSWVGEDRFGDGDLFELVQEGAISTGTFASFLRSIFTGDAATSSATGEKVVNGRTLASFSFRVPKEKSRYLVGSRHHYVTVGYEGTFLADPKTSGLVQLVISTSQPVPEMGACEATTTLDYREAALNKSDFLLPSEVRLHIVGLDGTELDNRAAYADCHEFTGEATLSFEAAPDVLAAKPAADPVAPSTFPPNLPLKLAFAQDIDAAAVAAGDRIRAVLASDIRDANSRVVATKGTAVTARVVQVQHIFSPPQHPEEKKKRSFASIRTQARDWQPALTIGLKLKTIEVEGKEQPFSGVVEPGSRTIAKGIVLRPRRAQIGISDSIEDRTVGVFEFRDAEGKYVVKSGLESNWLTGVPAPRSRLEAAGKN